MLATNNYAIRVPVCCMQERFHLRARQAVPDGQFLDQHTVSVETWLRHEGLSISVLVVTAANQPTLKSLRTPRLTCMANPSFPSNILQIAYLSGEKMSATDAIVSPPWLWFNWYPPRVFPWPLWAYIRRSSPIGVCSDYEGILQRWFVIPRTRLIHYWNIQNGHINIICALWYKN